MKKKKKSLCAQGTMLCWLDAEGSGSGLLFFNAGHSSKIKNNCHGGADPRRRPSSFGSLSEKGLRYPKRSLHQPDITLAR